MAVFNRLSSLLTNAPKYISRYGHEASKIFRNPLMRLALGSRSDIIADYIDKFTDKVPAIAKAIY